MKLIKKKYVKGISLQFAKIPKINNLWTFFEAWEVKVEIKKWSSLKAPEQEYIFFKIFSKFKYFRNILSMLHEE